MSASVLRIPGRAAIERDLPIELMHQWAVREGNRKRPIYELHKWWARRLGTTFRMLLLAATTPSRKTRSLNEETFLHSHDLSAITVLDPFMGGGTSLVESAKCGAQVIGVDIDPVACFVTSKELEAVDPKLIRAGFEQVAAIAKEKVLARYATKSPDGQDAQTVYAFWVDELTCPDCGHEAAAHPHYQLFRDPRNLRQTVLCRACGALATVPLAWASFTCRACEERTVIDDGPIKGGKLCCTECGKRSSFSDLTSPEELPRHRLFALDILTDTGERLIKAPDLRDRATYARAARTWEAGTTEAKYVPTDEIPADARYDNRPLIYGYRRYSDLFNPRQLLNLSEIAAAIRTINDPAVRGFLLLALSDCLASNNMFCSFAFDYRKLTPLFGLHAYRRVVRPVEGNVWGVDEGRGSFRRCVEKVIRGKEYALRPYEFRYRKGEPVPVETGDRIAVSFGEAQASSARSRGHILNGSASMLTGIADHSVDLVLSDPPYYDNLPYSELSDFYHVWLRKILADDYVGKDRLHTPWLESLFVGRKGRDRISETQTFISTLTEAFRECARVLRPAGLMVFTFHHADPEAWEALGSAILQSPFTITNVLPVRSEGTSAFHSYGGSLKWDAVIVCRKGDRSTGTPSASRLKRFTSAQLDYWKQRLKRRLRAPDRKSLRRALAVQYLSRYVWTPAMGPLLAAAVADERAKG